jgi:hypothetical protein
MAKPKPKPKTKFLAESAAAKLIGATSLPRKTQNKPASDDDPTGAHGPRKAVVIPPDAKWISATQVCARYGGRSLMWLARKLKLDPDFPKPTFFGPLRYWQPVALDAYDEAIIRLSDERPPKRYGVAASK